MDFLKEIKKFRDKIIEYRRYFHMHPEVSGKEHETADFIAGELEKMGIKVIKRGTRPQEIVKEIYTNDDKKTITIQGEPLPGVHEILASRWNETIY